MVSLNSKSVNELRRTLSARPDQGASSPTPSASPAADHHAIQGPRLMQCSQEVLALKQRSMAIHARGLSTQRASKGSRLKAVEPSHIPRAAPGAELINIAFGC